MHSESNIAFKEWAAVVESLARGMYVLSLRKGGIHEKQGEFSVEHREYFLFPTYLHQRESDLAPAVLPLLAEARASVRDESQIPIRFYVTVERAVYLDDLALAHALDGLHPFTAAGVEARFHYKKPGLWAIVQRVYALPQAFLLENQRHYAGCRSWVPLVESLSTAGAKPVLEETEFAKRLAPIIKIIGPIRPIGPMTTYAPRPSPSPP